MADYPINKGIGHSVEFKGLKAQYLFIFAGGLLAVFFLVVVLYMAGADQLVCIGLGLTLGSLLVWGIFHLNNKYGEHGLMKLLAAKSHPRYILNRRKTNRMFKHKKKEEGEISENQAPMRASFRCFPWSKAASSPRMATSRSPTR